MTVFFKKKPKAFICYRRKDAMAAGRIYKSLVERLGRKRVFKDDASLSLGVDWREKIKNEIGNCQLFFVIIDECFASSAAKLYDESDPVRFEIETAFLEHKLIIPILIDGTGMPSENEIPESIRPFVLKIGYPIDSTYWDRDFADLEKRFFKSVNNAIKGFIYRKARIYVSYFLILAPLSFLAWELLNEIFVSEPVYEEINAKDPAGTEYCTIKIGGKVFLAENLNYKTPGSYCLDSTGQVCGEYGRYYSWGTAVGVCSCLGEGWRLPGPDDWTTLQEGIKEGPYSKDADNKFLFFAVRKKEQNILDLLMGRKRSGFDALCSGFRGARGNFDAVGNFAYFWSADPNYLNSERAPYFHLNCIEKSVHIGSFDKAFAINVRCVKDGM